MAQNGLMSSWMSLSTNKMSMSTAIFTVFPKNVVVENDELNQLNGSIKLKDSKFNLKIMIRDSLLHSNKRKKVKWKNTKDIYWYIYSVESNILTYCTSNCVHLAFVWFPFIFISLTSVYDSFNKEPVYMFRSYIFIESIISPLYKTLKVTIIIS